MQMRGYSVLLNFLPASGPCLARWSNAPGRCARSGKAGRLHFPTVDQSALQDALQPELQRLPSIALRPLLFMLVLGIPSMRSDCPAVIRLSLLEAPKQSIDHLDMPYADVDFGPRCRFPSRTASLDLCVASTAKITYLTRYFGSVGNSLPSSWVHQSDVAQAMVHDVFKGREVTLRRHIILIRSFSDKEQRRYVRTTGQGPV
jgi:hypothetical protein